MISLIAASSASASKPSFARNASKLSPRSIVPLLFVRTGFFIRRSPVCASARGQCRAAASFAFSFQSRAAAHFAPHDAEDDAGNSSAAQVAANLEEPVAERAAIGHTNRPAEFDLLD